MGTVGTPSGHPPHLSFFYQPATVLPMEKWKELVAIGRRLIEIGEAMRVPSPGAAPTPQLVIPQAESLRTADVIRANGLERTRANEMLCGRALRAAGWTRRRVWQQGWVFTRPDHHEAPRMPQERVSGAERPEVALDDEKPF